MSSSSKIKLLLQILAITAIVGAGVWSAAHILLASIGKDINAYDVQVGGGTVYANINKQRVSASLPDGQWSEVQLVYDGSTEKLYLNGVLQSSAALSGAVTTNDNSFHIGTFGRATIDEVKIYNYARSAAQVAFDYNGGLPTWEWKFDKGEGGTAYDSSGRGANGTIYPGAGGTNTATSTMWNNGASGKINGSLDFDGTDDYVNVGSVGTTTAVAFWIYADNSSKDIIDFDGGTHSIEVTSGTISATGWSSPTIYVNGVKNATTIATGAWYHLAVTTATAFNASAVKFGTETSYFDGKLDDIRFYNYQRTDAQILLDYNGGGAVRF